MVTLSIKVCKYTENCGFPLTNQTTALKTKTKESIGSLPWQFHALAGDFLVLAEQGSNFTQAFEVILLKIRATTEALLGDHQTKLRELHPDFRESHSKMLDTDKKARLKAASTRYQTLLSRSYTQLTIEEQMFMQNFCCYRQLLLSEAIKFIEKCQQENV